MSSLYKELAYNRVIYRIKGVQFSVLNESEIRSRSVCEVTEARTFDGSDPVPNGLFDPRMGVIDAGRLCVTCRQRNTFCPGHFGHVVLARPCFHIQFYDVVRKILGCVCVRCSRFLLDRSNPDVKAILGRKGLSNQRKWDGILKLCARVKRCGQYNTNGCGARRPDTISKTDDMKIRLVYKETTTKKASEDSNDAEKDTLAGGDADEGVEDDDEDQGAPRTTDQAGGAAGGASRHGAASATPAQAERASPTEVTLGADDVLRIFRRITDDDVRCLGMDPTYNRPDWMICTVLPVPPPAVRPSVRHESGQRQEDDLTHKLCDIIKTNNTIIDKVQKGSSFETVDHWVALLQYHLSTFVDNSLNGVYPSKDRAGRSFRSLCERLGHKEGRIRGNLMGKRVDFSARTVITPDPNLSIDELGVPLKIAMNLTIPEVVNVHNIDRLRMLVRTGTGGYPGAKHVIKDNDGSSRNIRLKDHPDLRSVADELAVGDVVERHLANNDYVLFNRQPSLHKMSMMGHRVRVMPYNTFRLNVCVCACYNADFDGDEMNMHVPQSAQTSYELRSLAAVPNHIISPRYSKPIVSIVQDIALGVYRITQDDVHVSERQLFNLICSNPVTDVRQIEPPSEVADESVAEEGSLTTWSGRQVLSTVLPPGLNVTIPMDSDEGVPDVVIRDGSIKSGVITASVYDKASDGIVHTSYNTMGPNVVTLLLNGTQKLICDWLVLTGFSVGISDLFLDRTAKDEIRAKLRSAKDGVNDLIRQIHEKSFHNVSTKSDVEFFEDQVSNILSAGAKEAEKVGMRNASARNRMMNMIKSGSKGKIMNFTQMVACLAGQSIEDQRVPNGFDNRTLPHFTKYDDSPEARGFVESSFMDGLQPHEFFFHSMAGRIGLISTAVRTSETGYIQRKLIKAMEDCKIQHDMTVRNANGYIIQYLYGEDGMDATKLEFHKLPYLHMDPSDMRADYLLCGPTELALYSSVTLGDADWAALEGHYRQILEDRRFVIKSMCHSSNEDVPIVYPVKIDRIIQGVCGAHVVDDETVPSDLSPARVLTVIDDLIRYTSIGLDVDPKHRNMQWSAILLRCFLSPKQLICKYRLNNRLFDRVVADIRQAFVDSLVSPSEMVGIVAAQSIGEPCTQLSQAYDSRVLLRVKDVVYHGPIGFFVDCYMKARAERVLAVPNHANSVVMNTNLYDDDIHVIGLTDNLNDKTSWRHITQLSRHPANGGLLKVTTAMGRSTSATLSHSFMACTPLVRCAPVQGSSLRIGDLIPVVQYIPVVTTPISSTNGAALNEASGCLFGCLLAHKPYFSLSHGSASFILTTHTAAFEGYIISVMTSMGVMVDHLTKRVFVSDTSSTFFRSILESDRFPEWVFACDLPFLRGVVFGVLSCIQATSASSMRMSEDFSLLLCYLNVCSVVQVNGAVNLATASDRDTLVHALRETFGELVTLEFANVINGLVLGIVRRVPHIRESVSYVASMLGVTLPHLSDPDPYERVDFETVKYLNDMLGGSWSADVYREVYPDSEKHVAAIRAATASNIFWDSIVSISCVDAEYVYDFTVLGNESFMVDNGIIVHNTLNTFHLAGASTAGSVTSGVPRMRELLNMSKNIKTPSMHIFLRRDWSSSMSQAKEVMVNLQTTKLIDVLKTSSIYFDPKNNANPDDDGLMKFYNKVQSLYYGDDATGSFSPWVLRLEFDMEKMINKRVRVIDIEHSVNSSYDDITSTVFSDDNASSIVCRIRLRESATTDMFTEIKALEHSIIENCVIKGVPGIQRAVVKKPASGLKRYDYDTDTFVTNDEWTIDTAGSNLLDVMRNDYVDYTLTRTNDVHEVLNVLGIEAARRVLIEELRAVLGDLPLDHRHLSLLADTMTNRGFFMSVDRHGINTRSDLGPLAKCSFEQSVEMLIKAGVFSDYDAMTGVSANIMLGQVAPCGTGDCDILVDREKLSDINSEAPKKFSAVMEQAALEHGPETANASDGSAAHGMTTSLLSVNSVSFDASKLIAADEIEIV